MSGQRSPRGPRAVGTRLDEHPRAVGPTRMVAPAAGAEPGRDWRPRRRFGIANLARGAWASLLLGACATHPRGPLARPASATITSATAGAIASGATPGATAPPALLVADGEPPRGGDPPADLAGDLIGWAVLSDGTPLIRTIARIGQLAPPAAGSEEASVRLVAAHLLGIDPGALRGIDLHRPAAIALLKPGGERLGGAPPWIALLPVTSRQTAEQGFTQAGLAVEPQPGGVAVGTPRGKAYVLFGDGGLAAVAFRPELARAAQSLLRPVLTQPGEAPLMVHVDMAHVYALFGAELEVVLGRFAEATQAGGGLDPQVTFALRHARRFIRFADSLLALDVLIGADDTGLTLTARVDGRPGGAFAAYVASQQEGGGWGLALLPADAVLVYSTHRSAATAREELDAAIDYVGDAMVPPTPAAARAGWRGALERAVAETGGDLAYGVWPGIGGGIGLGGAFRVHPGGAARRETLAAYRRLGGQLVGVVGRALGLDAKRFPLAVRVRAGADRVAGVPVDTVEIDVHWPADGTSERHLFQELFGARLVLFTAFVGEHGLFTLGHDGRARLAAMIKAARGAPGAGSVADDPRLKGALGIHPEGRISFTWLPTAAMAGFIDRLLRASRSGPGAPPGEAMLMDAGDGCILTTTHASGTRYQVSTQLPASSLPGLPRIGGLLWRMAISPLLNPPTLPPLPLPPAHVAPHPEVARPDAARPDRKL